MAEKWENFTSAIEPLQSQRTQVKRFQMKELDDVISGLEGEISELEVSKFIDVVYNVRYYPVTIPLAIPH